jgi:DNA helicase-2/ATP-dependent DNA helicase PcrA
MQNAKCKMQNSDTVRTPAIDELLKMYDESWIDDWYLSKDQKEKYYKKGKDILKEFYESNKDKWTIPVALESFFKIKLGDYFISGRIDRVDKLADGSLQIIDYKTGQSKEKVEGDDKNQLLIYQLAANSLQEYKNFGAVSNLTFCYLEDNLQVSFLGDDDDISELKDKLLEIIENIKSGNFTATPAEHLCSHCNFKEICEFRKL